MAHPELGRDVGDPGLVVALAREHALGRVEDLVAALGSPVGRAHASAPSRTPVRTPWASTSKRARRRRRSIVVQG